MLPTKKLKRTEGKLLTLMDAVLPDGNQSKATKDMVKQIIGELYSYADNEDSRFDYVVDTGTSYTNYDVTPETKSNKK